MPESFSTQLRSAIRKHVTQVHETDEENIKKLTQAGVASFEELISTVMNKHINREIRQVGCWALGKLAKKRAVYALLATFSESEPDLYWESAKSLGLLGSTRAVKPLIHILQDDLDANKRAASAYALGLIADKRSTEALLRVVSNPTETPQVRGHAVEALANMEPNNKIIDTLIECVKDSHEEVQRWSVFALGQLGDMRAIPVLEELVSTSVTPRQGIEDIVKEVKDAIAAIRAPGAS
ncbi:HEAT repeat domain-containing protein [bacterium]|nr:HEAT repeat domain-containing protein [bacterium]